MKYFILSIIPSEDIVIKIQYLRTLLFKEFALISSKCLPVIIPIAYTTEYINKERFKGLTLPKVICTSACTISKKNDIYLKISNNNFNKEIKKIIQGKESNPITEGFIDLHTGFYLATVKTYLQIKKLDIFVNSKMKQPLIWKKNSLELIQIEIFNNIWWENIKWETIWDIRISNRRVDKTY